MVDDLGWHDVSFNAGLLGDDPYRDFTTPNIDKLANSGVKLPNYYTITICTPTRVSMLTGRQPVESGMQIGVGNTGTLASMPLDMPVLSEHLLDLGYETHMGGKWHVGYSNVEQTPVGRGFEEFKGCLQGAKNFFTHDINITGNSFQGGFRGTCSCDDDPTTANFTDDSIVENGYDLWHANARDKTMRPIATENEGVYDTDIVTDFIIDKIENRRRRPLFLYAAYTAPHDPWQAPDRFTNTSECAAIANPDRVQLCGMIKSIDDALGRIVTTLQTEGIDDDTLIVFTSDNGAAVWIPYNNDQRAGSNWPLRGGKITHFEGGTRVPAFIWGNPVRRGSSRLNGGGETYENIFHVSDWSLTLQEAAGSDGPTEYYGAEFNGERYLSSASHWDALTELSSDFRPKWRWSKRHKRWQRRVPPRGKSQLMLYNHESPLAAAARNNDYKLYRVDALFLDGYFDPSNTTRESVICENPFGPGCSFNRTLPEVIMFKLSEDPLEQNTIDATDYSALTDEQKAAYDELDAYLTYWGNVARPPQITSVFGLQYMDCNAAAEFHDCTWAPWLNSDDPIFDLDVFDLDTDENCRLNNAANDPVCLPNRQDEWHQYAASG